MNKVTECNQNDSDPIGTVYKGHSSGHHFIKYTGGYIVLENGRCYTSNDGTTKLPIGTCIKLEVNQ